MSNWINRLLGRKEQTVRQEAAGSKAENAYAGFRASDVVERILMDVQAEWTSRPIDGREGGTDYRFLYQRGDFHALVKDDEHDAHMHFLFFYDAPLGQLDNVRDACNQFNQRQPVLKVVYSVDAERHLLHTHLVTSFRLTLWNPALESDFCEMLMLFFDGARRFRKLLDDIVAHDVNNLEERRAFSEREQYLAHETEMHHQAAAWHTFDTRHLLLHDLMSLVMERDDIIYKTLQVVTDSAQPATADGATAGYCRLDDHEAIAAFDVTQMMVCDSGEGPRFSCEQTTLILTYLTGCSQERCIVNLSAEAEAEDVLYCRVTFTPDAQALSPSHSLASLSGSHPVARTFVMSYCRRSQAEKQAEFDYMRQEAQRRHDQGIELEDSERFIMLCEEADVAFNLYWGQRFFLAKQHYQALLHLENAYGALKPSFHSLTKLQRNLFFELCYYIGQCYMHLGMPRRAYYYLDGLFNLNSLRYTQAYINALVAAGDQRALGIVDNVLKNVQRVYDEQEADEEQRNRLKRFLLFLRRSKARVLIDAGLLEGAEMVLRDLLDDDKDHEAYLLEQVALVMRLRAQAAAEASAGSTLSVSTEFPKAEENTPNADREE